VFFQDLKTFLKPIIEVLRWNKPTGRLILLIPAGWSLWLTPNNNPNIYLVLQILFGGLFVSGFGCIANDIWDKDIDKKVLRTKNRPLAANKIKTKSAFFILLIFLLGSFLITLSLPEKGRFLCLILALIALPIILIYPSTKRWFKLPQAVLSICWGFSVLIPWAAHEGNLDSPILFLCWLATVCWTFGFDTVYALADKEYDQKIGINSSAITLGSYTKRTIQICYLITSLSIAACSFLMNLNFIFWPIWLITSALMQRDLIKIFRSKDFVISKISSHFRNQVIYGSLILLGLIIS
tara:strand:- start:350 stop:1234 length:885 start_codon:yes stop_codon:yes gene_type:complete